MPAPPTTRPRLRCAAGSVQLAKAFNDGKVDELVAMFVPTGELVDEQGTIHRGPQEIKALLTAFFKKFPGAR